MDELIEASNPEYLLWNFDQGFPPMDLMKDQLRQFGDKDIAALPVSSKAPYLRLAAQLRGSFDGSAVA